MRTSTGKQNARATDLSVVIPAYNEARRVRASLITVLDFLTNNFERFEIVLVDDGSTDGTAQEAESLESPHVRVLRNESNIGKGASVKRGVLDSQMNVILFSDTDLSTPIEELQLLLESIEEGHDVAIASRWLEKGQDVQRGFLRNIQGRAFSFIVRVLLIPDFPDTQCGFKMFRRDAAQRLFRAQSLQGWGFDIELLFLARKWGMSVGQVPVRWYKSNESKLKITTPLAMLRDILTVRWNHLLGRYDTPSAK